VGLLSTRIRTLSDSVMVVPNGKLADMPINNMGVRRRRNLMTTVTVTGGSTPEKIKDFTEAVFNRIDSDPSYMPRSTEVNVSAITATGIVVEVSATFHSKSGWEFRKATHQLFLDILHMAQAQGLTLGRGTNRLGA
jgi:MscS family membrane protein